MLRSKISGNDDMSLCPSANLAVALLAPNLDNHPDKIAYLCGDDVVSYRQLAEASCAFTMFLHEQGINAGERVMLALPDTPVFVAAFLGTVLAGAIAVPVSPALAEDDYRYILDDSRARLLLTAAIDSAAAACSLPEGVSRLVCGESLDGGLPSAVAALLVAPEPGPDDIAFMLYTSGSTGRPKGVPHRHRDMLVAAGQYAYGVLGITSKDLIFSASKLFFAYGLGNSLAFTLYAGASAVLHPGKPTPGEILRLIQRHRPSVFFSVPTVYAQIVRCVTTDRLELPMRLCVSAGEALPAALFEEWSRLTGLELLDGIGTTELFHIFISNCPGHAVSGVSGRPVPGYEIRLVDDTGLPVPSEIPGHLQVRGLSGTPGYWNLPGKTAAVILPDGFIATGDVLSEEGGSYRHLGRSDDMMKAGGQWIAPLPIEDVLRSHPAIVDCAIAGYRYGGLERPAAHLILKSGQTGDPAFERELRSFVSARLADHMRPVRYYYVEELPRTGTGKVQRFRLKS